MTTIEIDNERLNIYQEFKNNLTAVEEFFRHGDILVKKVNDTLLEIRGKLVNSEFSVFTIEDYNEMLNIRNAILYPIFQSASFATEVLPIADGAEEEPVIDTVVLTPVITTSNRVVGGILKGTTVVTSVGDKVVKTVDIDLTDGIVSGRVETVYNDQLTTYSSIKYYNGMETYHVDTRIQGTSIEIDVYNFTDGVHISTSKYVYDSGLLVENNIVTL